MRLHRLILPLLLACWSILPGADFIPPIIDANARVKALAAGDNLQLRAGNDFVLDAATGTMLGTASTEKLGVWGATPIIRPSGDVATALVNIGLITSPTVVATTAVDGTFRVLGSGDATKKLAFEVDAQTSGKVLTIDTGAQTLDRTLTVPVLAGNDTLVTLATATPHTGLVSVTNSGALIHRQASTQDGIGLLGRAGGSSSYTATITPTTLTASRTVTLPDADMVAAGSASALTSGRLPYVTTGGLLIDSVRLTWDNSITNMIVGDPAGGLSSGAGVQIAAPAGNTKYFDFYTGTTRRWRTSSTSAAETGSDAGSAWRLTAYTDAGVAIDNVFDVTRAAGGTVTIARPVTISGTNSLVVGGSVTASTDALTYQFGSTSGGSTSLVRIGGFLDLSSSANDWATTNTRAQIYGTNTAGAAYPFLEAGNLVIQPRISGAARDIILSTVASTVGVVVKRTTGALLVGTSTDDGTNKLQIVGGISQTGANPLSTGTGAISLNGTTTIAAGSQLFVGGSTTVGVVNISGSANSALSGASQFAYRTTYTGNSSATTKISAYDAEATTAAGSFTCASLVQYNVESAVSAGAGSTVTRAANYVSRTQTVGGTANFGFYHRSGSSTLNGSGTWCFYNDSSDNNYFGTGATVIGTTSFVGSEKLRINGGTIATATSTDVIIGGGALGVGATTDSTSTTTGSIITAGGIGFGVTKSAFGGGFFSTSPTIGIGYATGAGGTVTQATSKSTGVTLNKVTGQITLNNAALAAATSVGFTLTNSAIAATDTVHVSIASGATADSYTVTVDATAAGSCRISIRNVSAGSLSEAVVLNFTVMKGASS